MTTKDKIIALIDHYSGGSQKEFSETIGVSASVIGNMLARGGNPSFDLLQKIIIAFEDINLEWLITGKGEMLKGVSNKEKEEVLELASNAVLETEAVEKKRVVKPIIKENQRKAAVAYPLEFGKGKGIPLIKIEAMAGFGEGDLTVMDYDTTLYNVPGFENANFMIMIKGSSMYPKYSSGDIVACVKIPLDTFFQWNKVYVLDTTQGAIIKRIKESDREEHILCFSDNTAYAPFHLHLKEVRALAIVIGVIRLE